jgi:hypothetical protein
MIGVNGSPQRLAPEASGLVHVGGAAVPLVIGSDDRYIEPLLPSPMALGQSALRNPEEGGDV